LFVCGKIKNRGISDFIDVEVICNIDIKDADLVHKLFFRICLLQLHHSDLLLLLQFDQLLLTLDGLRLFFDGGSFLFLFNWLFLFIVLLFSFFFGLSISRIKI
jgi:hypothetical protein